MANLDDIESLRAEVARLSALLADSELHERAVRDELLVRSETLESHTRSLESMLDWYADLYEFAPVAFLALDGAGLVRDINLTGATLLGTERLRMLDRPMRLHVAPADRRRFLDHMLRCRQTRGEVVTELSVLAADGRELPVQMISRRATVTTEAGLTFRTAMFDLSARKRQEEELHMSHQRLALALAASEAGLFEYTCADRRVYATPRWAEIVGHPYTALGPPEALWGWFAAQVDRADRGERERRLVDFLGGKTPRYAAEFRLRRADGSVVWLREFAQVAQLDAFGHPQRVVGVLLDITAERQRLADAERRTAQLRALSAALFAVEENERRELAGLLHDDLGQRLVAVRLKLAAAGSGSPELAEAAEILGQTQAVVRSLTFQLSPPILQDLGLVAGLRWLARELESHYGLKVEVEDDGPLPPLAGDWNYLIFRCVRELLLNVVKHAGVSAARVTSTGQASPTHVVITVEDEGAGFDPERAAEARLSRQSFGLLSVEERIEGLGGAVKIDSAPGEGTRVELVVPRAPAA